MQESKRNRFKPKEYDCIMLQICLGFFVSWEILGTLFCQLSVVCGEKASISQTFSGMEFVFSLLRVLV